MIISALVFILILAVLCAVAYVAHYFVTSFLPPPVQMPALFVCGIVLLIILVYVSARHFGVVLP